MFINNNTRILKWMDSRFLPITKLKRSILQSKRTCTRSEEPSNVQNGFNNQTIKITGYIKRKGAEDGRNVSKHCGKIDVDERVFRKL